MKAVDLGVRQMKTNVTEYFFNFIVELFDPSNCAHIYIR